MLTLVRVAGGSMRPALEAGDRLLVVRRRRYRPGDIVAVRDPRQPTRVVVKRVAVDGGDPDASTDSRTFGPVPRAAVLGRAVYRYAPADRAGRV